MPTKTAPAPAAAPAATGIKKINLAGISASKEKTTGTAYPILPDPSGDVAALASDLIAESRELEALESSIEIKKAEIRSIAQGFFFEHLHGKHDIPSSVEAVGKNPGENVLITFSSRYKTIPDESGLLETIGPERTAQYFRQSFELKVDGDKIPADNAEQLIMELQALFAGYNASEALTAKSVIKPTPDFHTARHSTLSVEENMAVETICPCVAIVKTKGRVKK
jgi:hypothetical protein